MIPSYLKSVLRPFATFAANTVLVIVVLPILYLVEPFWRFRISHFATERMGHLTGDVHLFLARRKLHGRAPRTTHVLLGGHPCNRQLLSMWQRILPISDSPIASTLWHYCKNILRRTRFDIAVEQTDDVHYEFSIEVPRPSFTKTEANKGRELLVRMGIGPDDWFAVIHCRDVSYTRSHFPEWTEEKLTAGMGKHRNRNGNIGDYILAAEYVTERGGFALRTGAVVETPLPDTGNPRIIDYSTRFRSDFGDLYLAGKARFYLGGPSGLPAASMIFGVPVALANMVHLTPHCVGPCSLYNPVFLRDTSTGKLLHYREAFEKGLFDCPDGVPIYKSHQFAAFALVVEHNSPEDILDLCKDILDQVNGVAPPAEAVALQEFYRETYTHKMAGYRYAPTIGARFALKYRHLIE